MTLYNIENTLPSIITFRYPKDYEMAKVFVYEKHMGMLYHGFEGELYYISMCYIDNTSEYYRRDTFLSYFDQELLLSIRQEYNNLYIQIYKLEPKFRVVYK